MAKKHSARASASRVIAEVMHKKRSLNGVLAAALPSLPENERSLCQQLCYGVIRWQPQLLAISQQLLSKSLKAKDSDVLALLLCGLYQLRVMRTPAHAAISETVNATKTMGKPWAKGLINACLRSYQRQQEEIDETINHEQSAHYAHPDWLIESLKNDWPEHWQAILNANNQQAPMMLRVNQQQGSRDDYLQRLADINMQAGINENLESYILLDQASDVYQLPGFVDGDVSVQDGAAQYVADILDIKPDLRILDACAAPGGKTGHILEKHPENEVVALDISATRLQKIKQNMDRLKLNATLIASDATDVDNWWDGQLFDRILIDAPCSGTGVIRRHPDIKLLRRADDIAALASQQKQLLDSLWPLLKPDGLFVYTTCSALKQENELQMKDFLHTHTDAQEQRLNPEPAQARTFGYQRLPADNELDGFYYCCIKKV